MYNVLHILTGDDGGITAVVKNYYQNIDRKKFAFDLACITDNEGNDIACMKAMGANVFHLPRKSLGIKAYVRALKEILNAKKYDAVHVHENETSYIALWVAKTCGVKCRVAHSHTSSPFASLGGELRRLSGVLLNYHYATTVIGCGELAGERVFGKKNMKRKKAVVLLNAIELDKFSYDGEIRSDVRNELDLSDKFVVGFVGRLAYEKNPLFALKVVHEYHKLNKSAVLVMAGDGCEEAAMRRYMLENSMEDYVYLLGKRTDVLRLYQAFDVLILPSHHEGYPVVAVEALASGLPVALSRSITKELAFFDSVQYLGIDTVDDWVDFLSSVSSFDKEGFRSRALDLDRFDIKQIVKKLEAIYTASLV